MIHQTEYYYAPASFPELFAVRQQLKGEKYCYLAGGTDLKLPSNETMSAVIDLKRIPGLDTIERDGQSVRIGALVTVRALENSSVIQEDLPLVHQAARVFASRQIRERATVAGNICNRSASADIACALLCCGAELCWETENGPVMESLESFYDRCRAGQFDNTGSVLRELRVPVREGRQAAYRKLGERKAMDIGLVNCAVLKWDGGMNIALGSVASTPIRAKKAEKEYDGSDQKLNVELIGKIADAAVSECSPIDDIYASAEYRREMVRSLLKEALSGMEQGGDKK